MPSIAVVTDSTACLTEELVASSGVRVVPIHVIVDGRTYLDGVDITSDEVAAALSGGKSVTTSRPTASQFLEAYTEAAGSGAEAILSVHLSASLSGTLRTRHMSRITALAFMVPKVIICATWPYFSRTY